MKGVLNMRKDGFLTTREVINKVGLLNFIKSRIITPKQILETKKEYGFKGENLGEIIFFTRYHSLKAIEGYDFK